MMFGGIFRVIQGWVRLRGNTDGTLIGNDNDRLKVISYGSDPMADGVVTIEQGHHETHEGNHFHYSECFKLDDTDVKEFIFTANSTIYEHFFWTLGARERSFIYVFENPTFTGGTAKTMVNRNRNSSNTYSGTLVEAPTVTADGTELECVFIDKDHNTRASDEWILKAGEDYLIRVVSDKNGNDMAVGFNIYKEGAV